MKALTFPWCLNVDVHIANISDYVVMSFISFMSLLAIIEWGLEGYEEFCWSRRVLSTEAEGRGG